MKHTKSISISFFLFLVGHFCNIFFLISTHSVEGAIAQHQQERACLASSDGNYDGDCEAVNYETQNNYLQDQETILNSKHQESETKSAYTCEDKDEECAEWASLGECTANPRYMNVNCRRSCELCKDQIQEDTVLKLSELKRGVDMGIPQELPESESLTVKVHTLLKEAREYLQKEVKDLGLKVGVIDMCRNEHEMCTIWAAEGECEANPTYMKKTCAPVCKSCEYLTVEGRCPIDPNAPNAWAPGDLDAMFTRLTSEPYLSQYSVEVLSSPETTNGPWVITMENVLTEQEAEVLIELGSIEGYERSSDVGPLKPDGTYKPSINSGRTSTNAWCQKDCYNNATAFAVLERLSNITEIDEINSEYVQLLRYEENQHYGVHHDYIEHQLTRQQGVRILTVYLYLNDVPAGGGTNFDRLDLTVMPKRGRALLWPSVLNEDPNRKDVRTTHQALPVEAGVKYGANAWFHMRDFKTPNREGCQ